MANVTMILLSLTPEEAKLVREAVFKRLESSGVTEQDFRKYVKLYYILDEMIALERE